MAKEARMIHHFNEKGEVTYVTVRLPDREYLKRKKRRKSQGSSRRINRLK